MGAFLWVKKDNLLISNDFIYVMILFMSGQHKIVYKSITDKSTDFIGGYSYLTPSGLIPL